MVLRHGTPGEVGMSAARLSALEKTIARWAEEGYSPSMAYLVARDGVIVSHGAAGRLGPDPESPVLSPNALFPVASITKLFTATSIMMLTEDGLLSPVMPVAEFIPEFVGEKKKDVLIHHLLTHTSGLEDEAIKKISEERKDGFPFPHPEQTQDQDTQQRLCLGYDTPLSYETGTYMSYCSYGYELLGEIVRRVSGQSLDEFFAKRIFEPLGMKDSFMVVPQSVWDRVVKFAGNAIGAEWMSKPESLMRSSAAGGVYSTVLDMSVFAEMFRNGGEYNGERLLSAATVRAMVRNQTEGISSGWGSIRFPESGWGLGFMISVNKKDETGTIRSPEAYSHSGWGCTYVFIDPVYRTVLSFFQVTTECQLGRLNRRFDIVTDMALSAIESP